jgi:hypothetical protein
MIGNYHRWFTRRNCVLLFAYIYLHTSHHYSAGFQLVILSEGRFVTLEDMLPYFDPEYENFSQRINPPRWISNLNI